MLIPQEKLFNIETKIDRYNVASLAAATGVLTRPKKFPTLLGLFAHGTTGIVLYLKGDGGALGDTFALPAFDMAVETNELTAMPQFCLVNENFDVGEKIDILGTSLTLAAEISLYAIWGKSKLAGMPSLRYIRRTYTNTTDNETLDPFPLSAVDALSAYCRGVDLEASEFLIGGETRPGWIPGRQCSALNDCILPPQFYGIMVRGVGGDTISTGQHNHGTGGASDVFFGYTWR